MIFSNPTFQNCLWIGAGATLGACLRAGLAQYNAISLSPTSPLPLGTLIANILGGFLAGALIASLQKYSLNPQTLTAIRQFALTGFLGSLTTFSTFSLEVFTLFHLERWLAGVTLIVLHLGATLLATAMGFWIIKLT